MNSWDFYGTATTELTFAILAFIAAFLMYKKMGWFYILVTVAEGYDTLLIIINGEFRKLGLDWSTPVLFVFFAVNLVLNWRELFPKTKAVN